MWTFPIADGCASKAFLSVVTLFVSSHNPNTLQSAGADTPHVYFRGKQHWQCFKREKLLLKPNKFYFVCFYAKKVYLNLLHKLWWRRRWLLSLCVCVTNGNTADASHYDHLESLDAYFVFFFCRSFSFGRLKWCCVIWIRARYFAAVHHIVGSYDFARRNAFRSVCSCTAANLSDIINNN